MLEGTILVFVFVVFFFSFFFWHGQTFGQVLVALAVVVGIGVIPEISFVHTTTERERDERTR